jgi:hypothetical protein
MTVGQLIRDLECLPISARIYGEENTLIIGKNWQIHLETKIKREISKLYEDLKGVKEDDSD